MIKQLVCIALALSGSVAFCETKAEKVDINWKPKCVQLNPGHWLKGYSSCLDNFEAQAGAEKGKSKAIEATCKCIADGYTQDLECDELDRLRKDSKKAEMYGRKVAYRCISRLKM